MRAQAHTHTPCISMCVCVSVCWLCLLNCNKLIVIKHRLYILECVIGLFMLQFSPRRLSKTLPAPTPTGDFTSGTVNDCDKDGKLGVGMWG